jgi:hypothetical protein
VLKLTNRQNVCITFIGTWVTDEVKKAIDKGYILNSIYEVWHFENISQYDPNTKYVNTSRKCGWPKWCTTENKSIYICNSIMKKRGYNSTSIT